MDHGFIHTMNPVLVRVWGVNCYYYGLAYALGFLGVHIWLRWRRQALGWRVQDVYDFSILLALAVLLGGRLFSVMVYHWGYYRVHLSQIFSYWRGGMASHGVLLGGVAAIWVFSVCRRDTFLRIADEIAIPAAFLLALGRLGNFVNGQIVGTPTDLWWGVKFPAVEGLRHPVTLYESMKNLLLIPILFRVRKTWRPGTGGMTAHFVLWYGLLRIFCDCFRDHGAELFGIGRNQDFNAGMAVFGLVLLVFLRKRRRPVEEAGEPPISVVESPSSARWSLLPRRVILAGIVLFSLVVRSAWTPEVLEGHRPHTQIRNADGQGALSSAGTGQDAQPGDGR